MKRTLIIAHTLACVVSLFIGCGIKTTGIPQKAPDDFALCFSYWILPLQANIYDTYNKTIQKDLVMNGTATADLEVTKITLNEIYQKIYELEIYTITRDMTSENLTTTDLISDISPCMEYKITFTINGVEYTVQGDATAFSYANENPSADHFSQFVEFMTDLHQSTQEYQAIPDPEGGYM